MHPRQKERERKRERTHEKEDTRTREVLRVREMEGERGGGSGGKYKRGKIFTRYTWFTIYT